MYKYLKHPTGTKLPDMFKHYVSHRAHSEVGVTKSVSQRISVVTVNIELEGFTLTNQFAHAITIHLKNKIDGIV